MIAHFCIILVVLASGSMPEVCKEDVSDPLEDSELVLSFVIFRHGDRAADPGEAKLFKPRSDMQNISFYPYGLKALTNRGKQRGCSVGKWLRKRYDGWLPRDYISDHLLVRCSSCVRTQMTALAALSALYPPDNTLLSWNPNLNWQPIPYVYEPLETDPLEYWDSCPLFSELTTKLFERPDIRKQLEKYEYIFPELSKSCGTDITTIPQIFDLNNLFKCFRNVNINLPPDIVKLLPAVQNITNFIFTAENNDKEMMRISGGVMFDTVVTAMESAVATKTRPEPRLTLYSAHENNVASMMAAARVFHNQQPPYGATFALELRLKPQTEQYFVAAVYAADPAGDTAYLKVPGCGDTYLCDFNTFVELTRDARLDQDMYLELCATQSSSYGHRHDH